MLLQARDENGEPMSDQELRDELILLLLAGHESTAGALAWAVERLLAQPEVLGRALDEIERVVGSEDFRSEHLPKLTYLDAMIREVMRFRPVLPVTIRRARAPVTIAGYDLPSGVTVVVNAYAAHRRPETYPNPERFDPERFLENRYDPYTWLPFGGGTRRCIGMSFALHEMKVVLATILRRARLRAVDSGDARPVPRGFTLVPSGGMRAVVEARTERRRASESHHSLDEPEDHTAESEHERRSSRRRV
jgi:cytochrome P450